MPFKVKGTVVGFLGNEDKYPCHFKYKIGDEIIYDGEKYIGRLCAGFLPSINQKVLALRTAGPRYVEPSSYNPFWYAPISVHDESLKKYDGLGFRNVLETPVEPKYHMANLAPANAFKWPPHGERTVAKAAMVVCGDIRTAAVLKMEAFDISDKGHDVPYFRRNMVILSKVLPKQGIRVDKILDEFSREEIEGIYPALSQILVQALVDELELMDYLKIQDGRASVTNKGEAKLEDFKASLSAEEREALKI